MNQVLQQRSSQLSFPRNARPAVPGLEKYLGGRILSPDRRDSYETHLHPKHVAPTMPPRQGFKCPSSQRLVTRKCDCPLIAANNSLDSAFFFLFETTMNFETCDGCHSHQLIVLRKQNPKHPWKLPGPFEKKRQECSQYKHGLCARPTYNVFKLSKGGTHRLGMKRNTSCPVSQAAYLHLCFGNKFLSCLPYGRYWLEI